MTDLLFMNRRRAGGLVLLVSAVLTAGIARPAEFSLDSNVITIEAENATKIVGDFKANPDPGASGGKYMGVPLGTVLAGVSEMEKRPYLEFVLRAERETHFRIGGRGRSPKAGETDSFYVAVDGEKPIDWLIQPEATWRISNLDKLFSVKPGTHSLRIYCRETGSQIDTLIISKSLEHDLKVTLKSAKSDTVFPLRQPADIREEVSNIGRKEGLRLQCTYRLEDERGAVVWKKENVRELVYGSINKDILSFQPGRKGSFVLIASYQDEDDGVFQNRLAVRIVADTAERIALDRNGWIKDWLTCGHFANGMGIASYPYEEERVFPRHGYYSGGRQWRPYSSEDSLIDLYAVFDVKSPPGWAPGWAAYAHAYVWSPEAQKAVVEVQPNTGAMARVNGVLVLNTVDMKRNTSPVMLEKGWNRLLIKVWSRLRGSPCPWNFRARLLDAQMAPLYGLQVQMDCPFAESPLDSMMTDPASKEYEATTSLSLKTDHSGNVFFPEERVKVVFHVWQGYNDEDRNNPRWQKAFGKAVVKDKRPVLRRNLEYKIVDYWGRTVKEGSLPASYATAQAFRQELDLGKPGNGIYWVFVALKDGERIVRKPFTALAVVSHQPVWPQDRNEEILNNSIFGIASGWENFELMEKAGIKWVRPNTALYLYPQAYESEDRWQPVYAQFEAARRHNVRMLGGLVGAMGAARGDLGLVRIPTPVGEKEFHYNSQEYRDALAGYVGNAVGRLKKYTRCWEIDNEVDARSIASKGGPDMVARIVKIIYEAAHEADPGCKVVFPSVINNGGPLVPNILKVFAREGKNKDYHDLGNFHLYLYSGRTFYYHDGITCDLTDRILKMLESSTKASRTRLEANGFKEKPIWYTELGSLANERPDGGELGSGLTMEAENFIQNYVLALVQKARGKSNIEKLFWEWSLFGYEAPTPRPVFCACNTLTVELEDSEYLGQLGLPDVYEWLFRRRRDGKLVLALWSTRGTRELKLPSVLGEIEVVNIMGGRKNVSTKVQNTLTVTESPMFLEIGSTPALLDMIVNK